MKHFFPKELLSGLNKDWGKMRFSRHKQIAYLLAVILNVLGVFLKIQLDVIIPGGQSSVMPFVLAMVPIVLSSWYGGFGPGLLATFFSATLINYFFSSPESAFSFNPVNIAQLAIFILEGILISYVVGRTYSSQAAFYKVNEQVDILLENAADDITVKTGEKNLNFYNHAKLAGSPNGISLEEQTKQALKENDLRVAVEQGDLHVFYQPIYDIKKQTIVSVEALARWRHPELGIVSPANFIALAEETGIIFALDEKILNAACAQAAEWHKSNFPVKIAVNLSAHQFAQPGLLQKIQKALDRSGLSPKYLELEITESIAMQKTNFITEILISLKNMGISITIDDFGTGHSSFSYIKKFPIDIIKIDRIFVTDLPKNTQDAGIIEAVIRMAHGLGIKIVAEGVENKSQLQLLQKLKCDRVQGNYLSPPVNAVEMTKMLTKKATIKALL